MICIFKIIKKKDVGYQVCEGRIDGKYSFLCEIDSHVDIFDYQKFTEIERYLTSLCECQRNGSTVSLDKPKEIRDIILCDKASNTTSPLTKYSSVGERSTINLSDFPKGCRDIQTFSMRPGEKGYALSDKKIRLKDLIKALPKNSAIGRLRKEEQNNLKMLSKLAEIELAQEKIARLKELEEDISTFANSIYRQLVNLQTLESKARSEHVTEAGVDVLENLLLKNNTDNGAQLLGKWFDNLPSYKVSRADLFSRYLALSICVGGPILLFLGAGGVLGSVGVPAVLALYALGFSFSFFSFGIPCCIGEGVVPGIMRGIASTKEQLNYNQELATNKKTSVESFGLFLSRKNEVVAQEKSSETAELKLQNN